MAGKHKGVIRHIELLVGIALQWIICLLHLNELPLRHIFTTLDESTRSHDSFIGPMGNELSGDVCYCPVVILKSIPNKDFPVLPEDVVEDHYVCYRLCQAVMSGKCDHWYSVPF